MKIIICRYCCRKIVPYNNDPNNNTWVLAEPGDYETNIHKCQGSQKDHEPYINEKENQMFGPGDEEEVDLNDEISENSGTQPPETESSDQVDDDLIYINHG